MTARSGRRAIANETLTIIKQGYFETPTGIRLDIAYAQQMAEKNTITYSPEQLDQLIQHQKSAPLASETLFEVTGETTLDAARRLYDEGHHDVLSLNFASAKNPGGGFLGGSQAQEESLARATGLYPCLLQGREYYDTNRTSGTCMYTDYMIYSPGVPVFKDEEGNNLDTYRHTAVITAPAVNADVVKRQEIDHIVDIEPTMKSRIEKVLAIASNHAHSTLVLGAWGCGVFQNDPEAIAKYFREIIDAKFDRVFKKVVFAVYARNERFIKPFYAEFKK